MTANPNTCITQHVHVISEFHMFILIAALVVVILVINILDDRHD